MNAVQSSVGLDPVVPAYVPLALLVAFEGAAALAWLVVFKRRRSGDSERWCERCARLHDRTEVVGRAADALAVGALAYLVALPFVAAGFEAGVTFANALLAASAVAAAIAVVAEADVFARAAAARIWPQLTWSAEPARIAGGGARWLGAILVLYLFQPRDALLGRDAGIAALFGAVGERLVKDLGSVGTIWAAAALIAGACIASLIARWLIPLVFGSLPTALAARRELHGSAK